MNLNILIPKVNYIDSDDTIYARSTKLEFVIGRVDEETTDAVVLPATSDLRKRTKKLDNDMRLS